MTLLRTLIIEDDVSVARVHSEFVSARDGFVVLGEAHTGASALAEIERLKPDLVLLDFYLPDVSGLEILQRMRANGGAGIDVIAVTAARDIESVRRAAASGVRHYLVKPFHLSALGDRLDDVRRYRLGIAGADPRQPLGQREVDEILTGPETLKRLAPVPKGLSPTTLARVVEELRMPGDGWSAAEVAARVGLSRVGARRYLEYLLASGRASVVPRYGAIGRPENRYRLRETQV